MTSSEPGPRITADLSDADAVGAATLTVDLCAIRRNFQKLNGLAGPAVCAAAVKSDAYGLGIAAVVSALYAEGCRDFFVAQLSEGIEVRQLAREARIYILDGLPPTASPLFLEHQLWPVLGSPDEILEWAEFGRHVGSPLPAALHVDTGINRLGLTAPEVSRLACDTALLEAIDWQYIMSHLAFADFPDKPENEAQIQLFDTLRSKLSAMPASLANSAGTLMGANFHYDLVRPGIALYGGNPFSDRANPMETAACLEVPIMQIRELESGARVGYGGIWRAEHPSRIAVLQIGYGDGFFRSLGEEYRNSPPKVWIGGEFAPVVGRVSMDMITVDVTHIAPEKAARGSLAEVFGNNIPVDEFADWAGTISYEVLTSLSKRFKRVYLSGD